MGNSTRTLQSVADLAREHADISAVFNAPAGYANIALRIANKVMTQMLSPMFNFKWNQVAPITPFYTNQWQQDYASINPVSLASLKTLGWLTDCQAVDINNTQYPQFTGTLEIVRELPVVDARYASRAKICWMYNDQLRYATWGGTASVTANPQPNQVIAALLGAVTGPLNPWLQVRDPNGNLLVLTTFGTTGGSQPAWPGANAAAGVQVTDGSCKWTVVDPKGQGFRLVPLPAQGSRVYQVNVVGQARPVAFTTIGQMLDPIPDDMAPYFEDGFVARAFEFSPDAGKQRTWENKVKQWRDGLAEMMRGSDREPAAFGLVPTTDLMGDAGYVNLGPAWPYGMWGRWGQ